MQLKGKTVFLTGGAMGVGRAVAEAMLTSGAQVVFVDKAQEAGETTAAALRETHGQDSVTFIQCDVTDEDALKAAFNTAVERVGSIDVMVNNAGMLSEKNWKLMVLLNLNAVVAGTQLALEHMRRDKGGKGGLIINTSSAAGLLPGWEVPVYSATKHAVVGFTRSWAINPDCPAMGVRFGVVCPYAVDTTILNFSEDDVPYADALRKENAKVTLLRPETVAQAYLKLAGDDDSNGACCVVEPSGRMVYKSPVLVEGAEMKGLFD